ncbi:hypothetical protein [Celerinatantimonas diazotrophica]|uniref:Uncharacterized protein n=1 Tax=Celerinatantimonas diazotrophica TaxID=412034 RepID=A0A4R1JLU2_9GAMM|nr:hypothetical protein [Celerinatantimonas diazotrophica]TCK52038.1 hypothetical protein EV690_2138 [Celerinatantimonas diazotrophica]CAG9296259.1 hypothetical protein CEDIAZO_01407 [Celerinatantimonas diazotrophica]
MANSKSLPSSKPILPAQKSIVELVERYPTQTIRVLKAWLKQPNEKPRR